MIAKVRDKDLSCFSLVSFHFFSVGARKPQFTMLKWRCRVSLNAGEAKSIHAHQLDSFVVYLMPCPRTPSTKPQNLLMPGEILETATIQIHKPRKSDGTDAREGIDAKRSLFVTESVMGTFDK